MNEREVDESWQVLALRKAKPEIGLNRHTQPEIEGPVVEIVQENNFKEEYQIPFSHPIAVSLSAEEVTIVIFVLLLWAGAIALFYHQWGKINGLEPYQPDFVHANLTLHGAVTPPSDNFEVPGQTVCSPEGNYNTPSLLDLGGGSFPPLAGLKGKGRSESNYDFLCGQTSISPHKHKNSHSLEEPMTPSVVISFEAETALRSPQMNSEKSRPRSLVSLADFQQAASCSGGSYGSSIRQQVFTGKSNWCQQSCDSSCSTTSLQRAFDGMQMSKVGHGYTGGGGLLLPVSRPNHGRSMTSLHRVGHHSHLSSTASSVTSSRGFGNPKRALAIVHNRHLAESTLKLWQHKPQNFIFSGGIKERRKSLSVTSLNYKKADYV